MKNKFIYSPTKSLFEKKLAAGEIGEGSIVFVEDTKEIWTRGHYFAGESIDSNIISEITSEIDSLKSSKLDISTSELLFTSLQTSVETLTSNKLDKTEAESTYAVKTEVESTYATKAEVADLKWIVLEVPVD